MTMEHSARELQKLTGENKTMNNWKSKSADIVTNRLKKYGSSLCSKKTLKKRLPCLTWIPKYDVECLIGDSIAGLTVGLLVIPQALAYGLVAGLTPVYGLYSAFVGCFVYALLGSTNELTLGPTAIMCLLTYRYSNQGGADYAVLLCFLSGVIELIAAFINLGFFANFISKPVTSGFTSAAAITIGSSQLKGLFGLKKLKSSGVIDTWYKICLHIKESIWQDIVLGMACIAALSIIKYINTRYSKVPKKDSRKYDAYLRKFLFYLSVGRNALIVLIASLIAYSMDGENQPFSLTGKVESGIPSPQLPPFTTTIDNKTMTFEENVKELGLGVIMIPLIAILYDVAVANAFIKERGFDVTQEIITLSVINIIGSFFRSMPVTAVLSRTAVNVTSGVRTPAGGILTGVMVIVAMTVLTPFFKYIPKATLAAVIMCAVIQMFEYEIIKPIWRTKKIELIHFLITFFVCLFIGIEWGILLGIAVNLIFILFKLATPTVEVDVESLPQSNKQVVLVSPNTGMLYPSVMHMKTSILKAGIREGNGTLPVVIDCSHILDLDFTSSKMLAATMDAYSKRNQPLLFLRMKPKVISILKSVKEGATSYDTLEDVENTLYKQQITQA